MHSLFFSFSSVCSNAISNCATCASATQCSTCASGYYLPANKTQCIPNACPNGVFSTFPHLLFYRPFSQREGVSNGFSSYMVLHHCIMPAHIRSLCPLPMPAGQYDTGSRICASKQSIFSPGSCSIFLLSSVSSISLMCCLSSYHSDWSIDAIDAIGRLMRLVYLTKSAVELHSPVLVHEFDPTYGIL